MEQIENTRLSLDEIGDALRRLSSVDKDDSQSLEDFHSKIAAFFPHIQYESNESLWHEEVEEDETYRPLWWDDLDEPFELEELHWLTKIQKLELLKPDEVKTTMEAIEAGIFAQAALDGNLQSFNINKFGREKVERVAQRGIEAFNYMLEHNLKLGLHISRKYARRIELEDGFQYAFFGLIRAILKFDWRLGHQFSTYATWWVRQSLSREIADVESTIRLPVYVVERVNSYKRDLRELDENIFTIASEVTVRDKTGKILRTEPPLEQLTVAVEMDDTFKFALDTAREPLEFWDTFHQAPWLLAKYETPDDSISFIEFSTISRDLLDRLTRFVLSEQQVEILKMRNGFASSEPMTLDEIGKVYDVTRERIRQIESKALKRVYAFLEGVDLKNYWEVIERVSTEFQVSEANTPLALAAKKKAEKDNLRSERMKILHEQNKDRDLTYFENANMDRTKIAGESQVLQLVWAIEKTSGEDIPERTLEVARRRISNPELSLKELAATFNDPLITKDVVAGTIRRLIARATSVSGEIPPMTKL